jgi:hypothetical protein
MNASQTTASRNRAVLAGARPRQHAADAAKPRRRCSVEPPDLAITDFDASEFMGDLHNRIDHALYLFGELVPVGPNVLTLGLQTASRFKRFQDLDPFRELFPGFVQTIPHERHALHFSTRKLSGSGTRSRHERF